MSLSTNPFGAYDAPLAGSPFIGRTAALRVIEQRVLAVQEPGNLSIVGLPRIGKTRRRRIDTRHAAHLDQFC